MKIDVLKAAWNASTSQPVNAGETERLAHAVRARARAFNRAALLRRVYGTAAFGLALVLLAALAATPNIWMGMRVAMGLWAAAIVACIVGLWSTRTGNLVHADAPLGEYLQSCLRQTRREIVYQRSLRWRWWLPTGIGLLAAAAGKVPAQPDIAWLFAAVCAGFWIWGFVHGPRHWPQRLQPEVDALQAMLDDLPGRSVQHSTPGGAA